ncbi:S66 peptidase family protein [Adhaeribacter aquaticus]|uniref:S66 peptidase family protein n=1 Tax=Adhaeribacter aquaticus TaxID=299567 RepID=UPI0003FD2E66|nr:LD-carboxypeptidase [Adhaeribacter aquaticus]
MIAPLKPGDTIAICALARKVSISELEPAISIFKEWGLKVVLGASLSLEFHQFAGTDEERLADFQNLLDNPEVKAIISARGGYGTTRILDRIDFFTFKLNPKWLIGFSDITALLCQVHNFSIESIHATMPALFAKPGAEPAIQSLRKILFGHYDPYTCLAHKLNRLGKAKGTLVGGNLSILITCLGTSSEIDTAGKVLFLEDLDEYLYHIDRMMVQLDRAGKLKDLAGLVVGYMSDMKDNTIPFGKSAYEIIAEHAGKYNYPIAFGFPTGHEPENLALICGREVFLSVDSTGTTLEYTSPLIN